MSDYPTILKHQSPYHHDLILVYYLLNKLDTYITGHSGKRTMCSKLYNAGFDELLFKLKSGNRSDSVRLYQVPNIEKRKLASF